MFTRIVNRMTAYGRWLVHYANDWLIVHVFCFSMRKSRSQQLFLEIPTDDTVGVYLGDPYRVLGDASFGGDPLFRRDISGGLAVAIKCRTCPEHPVIYVRQIAFVGRARVLYESWRDEVLRELHAIPILEAEYPQALRDYAKAHD